MTMTDPGTHVGLEPEEFKAAFRQHPAGVAVITADAGHGPVGMTATSVISISAEPPLLVFSTSDQSSSSPSIRSAETVVVHLLGADDVDIARLCATSGIDRFADRSLWRRLPTGEPYFPEVAAWIRGRVIDRRRLGSSTLITGHAEQTSSQDATPSPLVYHDRRWHTLDQRSQLIG